MDSQQKGRELGSCPSSFTLATTGSLNNHLKFLTSAVNYLIFYRV